MSEIIQPEIEKIKYPIPDDMRECFEKFVKRPYDNHVHTDPWKQEILNQSYDYHRRYILEQGRTDFNIPFNGLPPRAKVLIYCYQYMQMHCMSSYHIFLKHWDLFNGYVACESDINTTEVAPLFVDFGCGPLTSGLAFSHLCMNKIAFHYIGIDRAKPMLATADDFRSNPKFGEKCTFDFLENYNTKTLLSLIDKYIYNNPNILIIFNFSYFFASTSINVQELLAIIRSILTKHNSNPVYIVFQNPPGTTINSKWHEFISYLPQFNTLINGPLLEEIQYEYTMNGYNNYKSVQLYYDLLQLQRSSL
ncbi:hypothetical protein [Nodularia sp. NIES-3585]|uniref:hypothetical protein n=1 Tax=Nodularia sp. NIES-3585 TaxID=1973477 RepID=UPI000B5CA72A|nr:hypothetical protein [Nodularia sp. NIES-3585]GAX34336.1 hypothetical protein NIES3585_03360 [Nodularia sp. NIES-3585]